MSLKKMFAAVSGVILAAQTLLPVNVLGATVFGEEMEDAYAYAYSAGVTTQYPIENANMFGAMTRAEMAKMLGAWAESVLGITPDTSKSCTFTDTASVKGDLADWIVKSCQMGLMGVGISAFRPFDTVSRAEFGTVLSRAIRGDENDGGTPYYLAHLNALKNAGIMTKIDDAENTKEVRGYVMIMLQRAESNEDVIAGGLSQCKDPLVALACALETSECPAICKEHADEIDTTVVKAGDLKVSVADYSSQIKSAPMKGTVVFNSVALKASEAITINSIVLERVGLSSRADISGVRFEKDGEAISSKGKVSSDGKVTVNFTRGFTVKSNEVLDLVVELNGAAAGSQVAFKLVDASSTAKNVSVEGETTTYQTVNYTVAVAKFTAVNGDDATYKLGSQKTYTFGEFKIENVYDTTGKEDKEIVIRSVVLNNASGFDLEGLLSNVQVYRDGKVVSKHVTLDGKTMVIALDDDEIAGGRTATYTIMGEIDSLERIPSYVNLELKKTSDLVAEEKATKFRTTNDAVAGAKSSVYAIEGGKIRFVNDNSFATSIDAGTGSNDVVVAQGVLEVAEPVLLKDLTISVPAGATLIKNMSIEVAGSRYGLDESTPGIWTIDEIAVSRDASVRVLVDLETNAAGNAITFSNITAGSFASNVEFLNNGEVLAPGQAIAGVIKLARINVKTPTFSLTETSNLSAQKVVVGDAATRVVFEGDLVAKKGDVAGRSIVIAANGNTLNANTKLALTVYINGKSYSCGTEGLGNAFTSCKVNQGLGTIGETPTKVKVEAYLDATNGAAAGKIALDIYADGKLDGNDTKSNTVTTVDLQVSPAASINVSNAGSANTIAIAGSNKTLATFSINVTNGFAELSGLVLSGAFSGSTSHKLFIDGDDVQAIATITPTTGNKLTFTGFNFYAAEGKHTVEIKASIPTDAPTGTAITIDSYDIDGSATKTGALSLKYFFVKVIPTITVKSVNSDKNEMIIQISNGYDTPITLDSIVATNVAGASIAGNVVTITEGTKQTGTFSAITLAKGDDPVELKLNVNASKTMTLDGLNYSIDDEDGTFTYAIDSTYADPIKWGDFRLAGK